MAQNYTINSYETSNEGLDDLQIMENNFECLRSMFSGSTSGSLPTTIAGMPWFDTTKNILKIRNADNDAWLGVMYGNSNSKIWIFENVARNGWAIDSSVTDCVLALKGGDSTSAYDTTGACVVSSWTQPDHVLTEAEIPIHVHSSAGDHTHNASTATGSGGSGYARLTFAPSQASSVVANAAGGHQHSSVGGDTEHNHGTIYRPKASIGTLQYPDV